MWRKSCRVTASAVAALCNLPRRLAFGSKGLLLTRDARHSMKLQDTTRRLFADVCATALLAGVAGVQCAKLTVPLDWQNPNDGRTTTIAVRVMRSKEGKGGLTFNPRQKPVEVQRLSQRSIRSCPPRALTRGQSTRYRFEVTYRSGSAQSRPHDRASCPIQILPIDQ